MNTADLGDLGDQTTPRNKPMATGDPTPTAAHSVATPTDAPKV